MNHPDLYLRHFPRKRTGFVGFSTARFFGTYAMLLSSQTALPHFYAAATPSLYVVCFNVGVYKRLLRGNALFRPQITHPRTKECRCSYCNVSLGKSHAFNNLIRVCLLLGNFLHIVQMQCFESLRTENRPHLKFVCSFVCLEKVELDC